MSGKPVMSAGKSGKTEPTYTAEEIRRAVEQEVEYMTRDASLADSIASEVVRRLEEEREENIAIGREG